MGNGYLWYMKLLGKFDMLIEYFNLKYLIIIKPHFTFKMHEALFNFVNCI